jgi:tetratricopeptide (TPR) repeat protein
VRSGARPLDDFTVELSTEEIRRRLHDDEDTLAYTGSMPFAVVWLTLCGTMGGLFGGLLVSGPLWRRWWAVAGCLVALPVMWQGMRLLSTRLMGPAIRWQAVVAFFWAFLLGMAAVVGAQIDAGYWAYGVAVGGGLLVGLVQGSLEPQFVRSRDIWLLALPLGGAGTALAVFVHRNMLDDRAALWAPALIGALAALVVAFPMALLLARFWDVVQALRHVAVICLHNDAFAAKAVDHLTRAIQRSPPSAELHNLRGLAWSRAGNRARAEEDWQTVMELDPRSADPHVSRGITFLRDNALEEAMTALQMAVRMKPKHALAHGSLGVVLERRGDLEQAIYHYSRAIDLAPGYALARASRGRAQFRAGRTQDALADLDDAIEVDEGLVVAYLNRGHVRVAMGDYDGAAEDYQAVFDSAVDAETMREVEKGFEAIGRSPD